MIQSIGVVFVFATIAAVIVTVSTTLFAHRGAQVAAGTVAGAWVGVLIDVTMAGALRNPLVLLLFFLVPFLVAAGAVVLSSGARERLLAIPRRLILGVNILRAIGILFVALAFAGQLSGPFPFSAGIGDVIVGIFAIPLLIAEPKLARTDARLVAWNTFGLLDLVGAVALGLTSANGSPLQLIHAGVGSAAITQLPWALVPLFLVPCYLIGHVIVFAQMRASARRAEFAVA